MYEVLKAEQITPQKHQKKLNPLCLSSYIYYLYRIPILYYFFRKLFTNKKFGYILVSLFVVGSFPQIIVKQ